MSHQTKERHIAPSCPRLPRHQLRSLPYATFILHMIKIIGTFLHILSSQHVSRVGPVGPTAVPGHAT
jgi:hypothetical protein